MALAGLAYDDLPPFRECLGTSEAHSQSSPAQWNAWVCSSPNPPHPATASPRARETTFALREPPTRSAVLAGLLSGLLLIAITLLFAARFSLCNAGEIGKLANATLQSDWNWMCEDDLFGALAFLPLHGLATCAFLARLGFALLEGCGTARRAVCCARTSHSSTSERFVTLRLLEMFIAAYTLCWFAPIELESAAAAAFGPDCVDKHESCSNWAATGECTKNEGFMRANCLAACKLCVPTQSHPSLLNLLGKLLYYNGAALVGTHHRPRLLAVALGGLLLILAVTRLLMPGVCCH